jgi:hypothetical protein
MKFEELNEIRRSWHEPCITRSPYMQPILSVMRADYAPTVSGLFRHQPVLTKVRLSFLIFFFILSKIALSFTGQSLLL